MSTFDNNDKNSFNLNNNKLGKGEHEFMKLESNFFESLPKTNHYYRNDEFIKDHPNCKSFKSSYNNCLKENNILCDKIGRAYKECLDKYISIS